MGLCLSVVVLLVSLTVFYTKLLVNFVTSAASLEFVATNASLLIVSAAIAAVICSRTNFFCGHGRGKGIEVIFEVIFVDKVVNGSALWGNSLA